MFSFKKLICILISIVVIEGYVGEQEKLRKKSVQKRSDGECHKLCKYNSGDVGQNLIFFNETSSLVGFISNRKNYSIFLDTSAEIVLYVNTSTSRGVIFTKFGVGYYVKSPLIDENILTFIQPVSGLTEILQLFHTNGIQFEITALNTTQEIATFFNEISQLGEQVPRDISQWQFFIQLARHWAVDVLKNSGVYVVYKRNFDFFATVFAYQKNSHNPGDFSKILGYLGNDSSEITGIFNCSHGSEQDFNSTREFLGFNRFMQILAKFDPTNVNISNILNATRNIANANEGLARIFDQTPGLKNYIRYFLQRRNGSSIIPDVFSSDWSTYVQRLPWFRNFFNNNSQTRNLTGLNTGNTSNDTPLDISEDWFRVLTMRQKDKRRSTSEKLIRFERLANQNRMTYM